MLHTSSISISSLSSFLAMEGLMPIIKGRGEPQKSISELGSTGMKVCCEKKYTYIEKQDTKINTHKMQYHQQR